MWWIVAVVSYLVGALIAGRVAWYYFSKDEVTPPPDVLHNDESEMATVTALIWPIVAVGTAGWAVFAGIRWFISRPTRAQRRRERMKRRQDYLAETERMSKELGLSTVAESMAEARKLADYVQSRGWPPDTPRVHIEDGVWTSTPPTIVCGPHGPLVEGEVWCERCMKDGGL